MRVFALVVKSAKKPMVRNEKAGGFLLFCAAPASAASRCEQFLLAVLLAAAHKSIWLFVSRFLIVGPAKRGLLSPFCSLDHGRRAFVWGDQRVYNAPVWPIVGR